MSSLTAIQERLHGSVSELVAQLGGTAAVEEDRIAIEATVEGHSRNQFSPYPYSELDKLAFPHLKDDSMGRVLIEIENADDIRSARWTRTTDRLTGLPVQVRAADCGAGCKCAAEVRIDIPVFRSMR